MPCIFAGVSIGGMIAQEIAQIVQPEMLILISTIQYNHEKPGVFKWANSPFVIPMLHKPFLKFVATVADKFTTKSPAGRKLFYAMLRSSDPDFVKFGARMAVNWDAPRAKVRVIRMHG